MEQKVLGKTGLPVSKLSLGGLFTSRLGPGFEESRRAVIRAVDLGINFIDTAPAYADSEEVLGRILRDIPVPVIISTKLGGRPQPFHPKDPAGLRRSVEESLRLLGREVIDVLFIHEPDRPGQYDWWTDAQAVEGPVLEVLDDLKRRGVIRFTGLGGTTCAELAHLVRSDRFDVVLTAFNQSVLFREASEEVIPAATERGMGIVLGSILQQGALARRFDDVVKNKPNWLSERRREQLRCLYALLDQGGWDIAELGIRLGCYHPDVSTTLIGPKTVGHVESAVRFADRGPLPSDVQKELLSIAQMVPYRPFEEPMILPFDKPRMYPGPGPANLAAGIPVGKLP